MKYRIKIISYKNGRKEFIPQFKGTFLWLGLNWDGETRTYDLPCQSREDALKKIDLHYSSNSKVQTIEFEYINK